MANIDERVDQSSPSDGLYPLVQPFHSEVLPFTPVHSLYVEQSGNPAGFPVLFLHGGPGSQTRPEHRRYFDPDFYHVVLFDQRGCGRSTPAGCTEENTTWHLVEDIETIRRKLGISRWMLFGGSWGSTLALAYATTYPQHVAGMVLRGVFLASRSELDWYLNGLRAFIPEAWAILANGSGADMIQRYHRDVNHNDRQFAVEAARRWVGYEHSVMAIGTPSQPAKSEIGGAPPQSATSGISDVPAQPSNVQPDGSAVLGPARVQLHYLAADCFLRAGELMERARAVAAPAIIVQGRSDMVCPPITAYELSKRLPAARLSIIEQAGHAASGTRLAAALRRAADDMRGCMRESI
jgi:proline iminopeptidase